MSEQTANEAVPEVPERFIPIRYVSVEMKLPSTHPLLVLQEVDPPGRVLQFPIGVAEGSAIAYAAREIESPRPLTHQFFAMTIESFGVTLETVRITEVIGQNFLAEAVFSSPQGQRTIKCRPSDGVCLALRQRLIAPISVAADVLDQVGFPTSG